MLSYLSVTPSRRRLEWLALGTLLVVVALVIGGALFREHGFIAAHEEQRLRGQSKVVEENLERQLQGVAHALAGMRDSLGGMRSSESLALASAKLALLNKAIPGVRTMAVLDADGQIVASARPELLGKNFRHRSYFEVPARSADADTLYVSAPIKASLDGFVVFLCQALHDRDGRFGGIVAATLNPAYFDVLLRSVIYAPDMRVSLVHGDGQVFVNVPADDATLGKDVGNAEALETRYRSAHADGGVAWGADPLTGQDRIVAMAQVNEPSLHMDKPLTVLISRDPAKVFYEWRSKAIRGTAFVLILTIACSAGLLYSQRRRDVMTALLAERSRERERSAKRLEIALQGADLGLWDLQFPGNELVMNRRERQMLGWIDDSDAPDVANWRELIHPDDRMVVRRAMAAHLAGRRATFDCEHRVRHRDGHWIWVSSRAMVTERDAAGSALRVIGTHMDITESKRTQEVLAHAAARLRLSEERLSLAIEGSQLALFDWDIARDRLYRSAQGAVLRGEAGMEAVTTADEANRHIHPEDLAAMQAGLKAALTGSAAVYQAEFRIGTKSGGWVWVRARGRVVERDANGRALRLAGTYANINEQKLAEQRLRHLAEYDSLTSLPNRSLFYDRLRQAILRASRTGPMALLFLDVDFFKHINDTLGHEAGDQLLRVFAQRMTSTVRQTDTVARLAGDEFTIILEGLGGVHDAKAVAGKLVATLSEPIALAGRCFQVTASIGIAMAREGDTEDPLLRRADEALYAAKKHGRNRYWCEAPAGVPGGPVAVRA